MNHERNNEHGKPKKYELTDETREVDGVTLHRIRALVDIPRHDVKAGDLGGWIEAERNLDQEFDAWVSDNARVCGDAWVYDNARVYGIARVSDNARVCGDAQVCGNAQGCGNARVCGDARVSGNAQVYGDAQVETLFDYATHMNCWSSGRTLTWTRSNRMWRAGCFYGTGEELIAKAYRDSELSGKCHEILVRAQEK